MKHCRCTAKPTGSSWSAGLPAHTNRRVGRDRRKHTCTLNLLCFLASQFFLGGSPTTKWDSSHGILGSAQAKPSAGGTPAGRLKARGGDVRFTRHVSKRKTGTAFEGGGPSLNIFLGVFNYCSTFFFHAAEKLIFPISTFTTNRRDRFA